MRWLITGLIVFAGCKMSAEEEACLDPEALHERCAKDGTVARPGPQPSECSFDCDGDGASVAVDCDDTNRNVYPGAIERCNLTDEDCDASTSCA